MKTFNSIYFVLLLLLCSGMAASAGNTISLSSASGSPGDVVSINLGLSCDDNIAALQVNIPLGDMAQYVASSAVLSADRSNGHGIAASETDGVLKILVYSIDMQPLNGTDGNLLSFSLSLNELPGSISLTPQDVIITDTEGNEVECSTSAGSLNVLCAQTAYSTLKFDLGRVPLQNTYYSTLRVTNTGTADLVITEFDFSDSSLSVQNELPVTIAPGNASDVKFAYAPVVRGSAKNTIRVKSNTVTKYNLIEFFAEPYAVNELHISNATGICDEEVELQLSVNNMDPICGFQFDFALPSQLKYVDGSFMLSDRKTDHQCVASLNDGKLKLIAFSISNQPFADNDGVIASFRVKLDGKYNATVEASDCIISCVLDGVPTNVTSATYSGTVYIQSPTINGNSSLSLGRQPVTALQSAVYTVRNYGNAPLVIDKVAFDSESFMLSDNFPVRLDNYGSSHDFVVFFAKDVSASYAGNMLIYTNDPSTRLKKVALTGEIYNPNFLTVNSVKYGVDILLNNYDAISGLQFDVTYPSSDFDVKESDFTVLNSFEGFSLMTRRLSNDSFRIFAYSLSDNVVLPNTDDAIIGMKMPPYDKTVWDNYPVKIENVILSSGNLENVASSSSASGYYIFDEFTSADFIADNTSVFASDGKLTITGASGSFIEVYDISGRLICREFAASDFHSITLPTSGIYIVKINTMTFKIAI